AGFAGITDLLGVLEHSKFALNVAFLVRHRYFLHPKSGNLSKVSQETVHIYSQGSSSVRVRMRPQGNRSLWLNSRKWTKSNLNLLDSKHCSKQTGTKLEQDQILYAINILIRGR
ncbi:MAG: hypothetical protein P8P53_09075, partial [Tateyamaria sp.]|nr:hypothetical protein [Tateyamaria sp.]